MYFMKKIFLPSLLFLLSAAIGLFSQSTQKGRELQPILCQIIPMEAMEKDSKLSSHIEQSLSEPIVRTTVPGTSMNWSGYVTTVNAFLDAKHSVSRVLGTWLVPAITAATIKSYSLIWVGMDGFSNNYMEQIGTAHNWGNGFQVNFAWFQMHPKKKFMIKGFPLNINDQIDADVHYVGDGVFSLVLKNLTQGVVFEVPKEYTKSAHAPRSSADWIVEVPFEQHLPLPLANFTTTLIPTNQTITFADSWAVIKGVKGGIGFGGWSNVGLTMTAQNGTTVKALPSVLTTPKTGFSVTWQSQ